MLAVLGDLLLDQAGIDYWPSGLTVFDKGQDLFAHQTRFDVAVDNLGFADQVSYRFVISVSYLLDNVWVFFDYLLANGSQFFGSSDSMPSRSSDCSMVSRSSIINSITFLPRDVSNLLSLISSRKAMNCSSETGK